MITATDTANILYKVCLGFGVPVYQAGNIPKGKIGAQGRCVIHAKEQSSETYWKKGFVEVNLFAADTEDGNADLIRLNELERLSRQLLECSGRYDDSFYKCTISSTVMMENSDLEAHFINAKVLFRVLNIVE